MDKRQKLDIDDHSAHSDEAALNVEPPQVELVSVIKDVQDRLIHSSDLRSRFIQRVRSLMVAFVDSLPHQLAQLKTLSATDVTKFQAEMAYLFSSINYVILLASPAESQLVEEGNKMLLVLREVENILLSYTRIRSTDSIVFSSLLSFDNYYYQSLFSLPITPQIRGLTLESLVFKQLEIKDYKHAIYLKDGRYSMNLHNQTSTDCEIKLFDRCYYTTYYEDVGWQKHLTHFYGCVFDFKKFVYHVAAESKGLDIKSSDIENFINRILRSPQQLALHSTVIKPQQIFMCFTNGVYILSEDTFIENNEALPRTHGFVADVPAVFHDRLFPYDAYSDVQITETDFLNCQCDGLTSCKCAVPRIITDIPTPHLDSILKSQGWPIGVWLMVYAFLGRCLHPLHSLDERLHMSIFFYGQGGTGKSTIINLVRLMLQSRSTIVIDNVSYVDTPTVHRATNNIHPDEKLIRTGIDDNYIDNVHEISPSVEENYPLQGCVGKMACIAPELRADSNFPQGLMLKMAAGENVSVSQKHVAPVSLSWKMATLFGMNEPVRSWVDSHGELSRRAVVLHFSQIPERRNQQLPELLIQELPLIIYKVNRVYLNWARFASQRDTYDSYDGRQKGAIQPSAYWQRTKNMFMQFVNPCQAFVAWIDSNNLVTYGTGFTSTSTELEALYKRYAAEDGNAGIPALNSRLRHRLGNHLTTISNVRTCWNQTQTAYTITGFKVNNRV